MNKTFFKKAVGAFGFILTFVSTFLLYNHTTLEGLLPRYGPVIAVSTTLTGSLLQWWGKQPWASPSVKDVIDSGDLVVGEGSSPGVTK